MEITQKKTKFKKIKIILTEEEERESDGLLKSKVISSVEAADKYFNYIDSLLDRKDLNIATRNLIIIIANTFIT